MATKLKDATRFTHRSKSKERPAGPGTCGLQNLESKMTWGYVVPIFALSALVVYILKQLPASGIRNKAWTRAGKDSEFFVNHLGLMLEGAMRLGLSFTQALLYTVTDGLERARRRFDDRGMTVGGIVPSSSDPYIVGQRTDGSALLSKKA